MQADSLALDRLGQIGYNTKTVDYKEIDKKKLIGVPEKKKNVDSE